MTDSLETSHTGVQRLARRFLEPAQDLWLRVMALSLLLLTLGAMLRFGDLRTPSSS